mgnify:CR=1 FL=1
MRVLILLFSISLSSSVLACQQPITINYAPFVSLLVVKKFFGSFHEQLQQTSGCAVSYVIQRNFDEFVAALYAREHTLAIVPGPYFNVLKQLNYSAVASQIQTKHRDLLVIAKKKSKLNSLADLAGRHVLVNSPLSASGNFFLDTISKLELLDKMTIQHLSSYDNMILLVLKGDADAAVIIPEYWEALDASVRNQHLNVVKKLRVKTSTEFVVLKEREDLAPLVYQALNTGSIKWGKPNKSAVGPKSLEQLLQLKLQQYQQSR